MPASPQGFICSRPPPPNSRSRQGHRQPATATGSLLGANEFLEFGFGLTIRAQFHVHPKGATVQGDAKVLEFLNQALKNELTSINQYFLHSRMLDNWGMKRLGKLEYEESIDEMKHADRLVKRILFLDGLPNLQDLGKLFIGENVQEILQCDLRREIEAHPMYKSAIACCESVKDYVTRDLLVDIQKSEEEHIDFIEEQLGLIEKMGLANYVQSAAGELEESQAG